MLFTGMVGELVNQAVVSELRVLLHLTTIEEVNNQKDSVCNMFSRGYFLLCHFRFEHRACQFTSREGAEMVESFKKTLKAKLLGFKT